MATRGAEGRAGRGDHLSARGGSIGRFFTTAELEAGGLSRRARARAVEEGLLLRVRHGVYASPDAHPDVLSVLRTGNRLACATAAAAAGLWVLRARPLHVQCGGRSRAGGPGVVAHWSEPRFPETASPYSVGLADALRQAVVCLPEVEAVAILDSALNTGRIDPDGLAAIAATLSAPRARVLDRVDGRAESGLETRLRFILEEGGLSFRSQAEVGPHRLDFLVEGRLGVEADGRAFHEAGRDYARDVSLAGHGVAALHFAAEQIWGDPCSVLRGIRSVLAGRAVA